MKYDFALFNTIENPLSALIVTVNEATSGLLIYAILLMLFIVASYVFLRRTNAIGKSLISGLHPVLILSLLLYDYGKILGYVLISDLVMLSLLIIESMAIGGIYFLRINKNE